MPDTKDNPCGRGANSISAEPSRSAPSPFRQSAAQRAKAKALNPQVAEERDPTPDTNEEGQVPDEPTAETEAAARTLGLAPRPLP